MPADDTAGGSAATLFAALLIALASWPRPVAGSLIKVGPPGFEVESLATWKGRVVRTIDLSGNKHTKEQRRL